MVCALVFTSGAGISVSAPMIGAIAKVYLLVRFLNSLLDKVLGSTFTPPFAPPYGILATAHFKDIHVANAFTSLNVQSS